MRGEEFQRLVDAHGQHLADGLAAQPHLQRLGVEARPAAAFSLRLSNKTSLARVDLPEPDTPVTTVRRPSGMRASMLLRLCSFAFCTSMESFLRETGRRGCTG